jgi:Protein of unknown function (DUF1573)
MRRALIVFVLVASAACSHAGSDVSTMRRLYDFTPVSATNPVIARVKKCDIEIPVSELRAYARTILSSDAGAVTGPLTLADKRRLLDGLLDDHFLLWDGYRQKADRTIQMSNLLESTKTMLLQETLEQQEVNDKAKTPAETQRLSRKLRDEIFDKTEVAVSNDSYDELKKVAANLNSAGTEAVDLNQLDPAVRDRVLAHWKGGVVTIGDVLAMWAGGPISQRPDLGKPEALTSLLKTMLEDALLAQEARDRGLEKAPIVVRKVQENRNVLTRMYVLDRITDRAVARMQEPDTAARVRAWYETNRTTRYTYRDDQGKPRELPFEANRDNIESDYVEALTEQLRAEYVRGLRKGRIVDIDQRLLEKTVITPPALAPSTLSASAMAWDADAKERVIRIGETNALFTFQFTNVFTNEITLFEMRPSCECTAVHAPSLPWTIKPGEQGTFDATVDLRGKTNSFSRSIQVESSQGSKTLTLHLVIPTTAPAVVQTPNL